MTDKYAGQKLDTKRIKRRAKAVKARAASPGEAKKRVIQLKLWHERMKRSNVKPEQLNWAEVHVILGKLTDQVHGVFRYLPSKHPGTFCQSLSVAGQALERLANDARAFVKKPPRISHDHK